MEIRKEVIGDATLYLGDCLDIMPALGKVDAVVTDPPYPDYYTEKYNYKVDTLKQLPIKTGFIFYSAKACFPLSYTAKHIWDKKTYTCPYEYIYEICGSKQYRVFRHYFINSTVAAKMTGDVFTGHKSQKPIKLMRELVILTKGNTILDPFMGSGTTGVAAVQEGRKFIGIEIDEKYFDIACKRIDEAQKQLGLFV